MSNKVKNSKIYIIQERVYMEQAKDNNEHVEKIWQSSDIAENKTFL